MHGWWSYTDKYMCFSQAMSPAVDDYFEMWCFPACFMLFLYLFSPQLGNKCSLREIIQLMLFSKLCISAALGAAASAEWSRTKHLKCLMNTRFSTAQPCHLRLKGIMVVVNNVFLRWGNSLAWVLLFMVLVCWPSGSGFCARDRILCLFFWSSCEVCFGFSVKLTLYCILFYSMCNPEQ
jgi:hypothetical protein